MERATQHRIGVERAGPSSGRRYSQLSGLNVDVLTGVGARKSAALGEMGIVTVLDLLTHYPRRYLDRTAQARLGDMSLGQEATVLATVKRVGLRTLRNRRSIVEVVIHDGPSHLYCTFFNQPWRAKQLVQGQDVVVFGKLEEYRGRTQMTNPVLDLLGDRTGRVVALYPQSDKAGLSTWELSKWMAEALDRAGEFADPLPNDVRHRLDLIGRTEAMRWIHAPSSMSQVNTARRRLAFDELLRLQLKLVMAKMATRRQARGITHRPGQAYQRFWESLPFTPTGAQVQAVADISADLIDSHPMHRLLQGDVGAGKTVVALAAMLVAVDGGHQAALMAPTEVLAEQHFLGVRSLLAHIVVPDSATLEGQRPSRVDLLTGRCTARERTRVLGDLASRRIDILIGTHALLSDPVNFASLGLVVIDEQHRFGVEQRALLRAKGRNEHDEGADPDILVMTATPIPRTAAMTVFGDLDVTVLGELPPGRTPIATTWCRDDGEINQAWERVRSEVAGGRQAYVVCPLVEDSEKVQATSATAEFVRLQAEELTDLRLGLIHGQMASAEKGQIMDDFRRGRIDVLVSTSVIEVGVDVPNATVMVIEDAGRFGMAQLHQLRGRVGRSALPSWCFLTGDAASPESENRLNALAASTDGFELAEVDLDQRGEGSILGARQQGRSDLKLASLAKDRELVAMARQVAFEIVDADPDLSGHQVLAEELKIMIEPEEAEFLFKS